MKKRGVDMVKEVTVKFSKNISKMDRMKKENSNKKKIFFSKKNISKSFFSKKRINLGNTIQKKGTQHHTQKK